MFDGEALGQQMVEIVRGYVTAELEPLRAENKALSESNAALAERVAALETRELVLTTEVDMEVVAVLVDDKVATTVSAAFATMPVPQDGKSVDMAEVKQLVEQAIAEIPPAKDGADCDMEAVKLLVAEEVAVAVSTLPPAEPGAPGEVDMDAVAVLIDKAVSERPLPQDGKDCDMVEVERILSERVADAVAALPAPKEGIGLADALKDQNGHLVLVMTDGSTKNLGPIDGKDGHTFTLDDFDIEPLDERTIKMGFTYGEVKHSFELAIPALIYRGVWREGETYQCGDMLTWGGSLWHCDKDGCTTKPDAGDYTLAVKKGRDGRDAAK